MAEDKTAPADKAGDATTELPATPEQTAEANEEDFEAAFEEFAAEDDAVTTAASDPGPEDEGQKAGAAAPAETTDGQAASGEESPGVEGAAPDGAAAPEDIWADASPEQKAAFEASKHENQSHRTRASAQNRKIAELMSAPESAAEPAADTAATPETDEGWEQFKSDYPEVAAPMEKRFEARMAKLEAENTDLRGRVTGITDAQTQGAIDNEEALLAQRHPDWEQLTASEDFATWLPDQPRYVQEGFARNGTAIVDGQEAASLIDLFKGNAPEPDPSKEPGPEPASKDTTTQGKATRRQRRLESAVQTESGQAGPGAGPPEGDFDAAFDHFAALT